MGEEVAQLRDDRNEHKLGIKSVWMWYCVTGLVVPAGSRDPSACKTLELIDTISYPSRLESSLKQLHHTKQLNSKKRKLYI